jgi:hypothetical protein
VIVSSLGLNCALVPPFTLGRFAGGRSLIERAFVFFEDCFGFGMSSSRDPGKWREGSRRGMGPPHFTAIPLLRARMADGIAFDGFEQLFERDAREEHVLKGRGEATKPKMQAAPV